MARVTVTTSLGFFVIELAEAEAPRTTANFLGYVDAAYYDASLFHRVIEGFMVQGGGYDTSYIKKVPNAPIESEADNGLKNVIGAVAMARTSDPHSAKAQFFVNVADNGFLDHRDKSDKGWGYTVFGRVVEGMDVVDAIRAQPAGSKGPFRKDAPLEDIVIKTVRRA
jgi:cyclophilin family peptidyl-prolyl cis-trans isomerase